MLFPDPSQVPILSMDANVKNLTVGGVPTMAANGGFFFNRGYIFLESSLLQPSYVFCKETPNWPPTAANDRQ